MSGGERKRVAIGIELLNNPKCLFADEPTTGLDSLAAERIVRIFNNYTKLGRTVIATLHQPNSRTVSRFDRLMLMGNKKIVFNGPVDDTVEFFDGAGYPVTAGNNPVEHYLNMLTADYKTSDCDYAQRMENIHTVFEMSTMGNSEP